MLWPHPCRPLRASQGALSHAREVEDSQSSACERGAGALARLPCSNSRQARVFGARESDRERGTLLTVAPRAANQQLMQAPCRAQRSAQGLLGGICQPVLAPVLAPVFAPVLALHSTSTQIQAPGFRV